MNKILRYSLFASVLSLVAALAAEYGFGLKPCHLCIAQRVPYALVIVLALWGLFTSRYRKLLVIIIGLAFLVDSGIASYHAAVEKQWVAGPSGCTMGEMPAHQSTEEFLKHIQEAPIVACDQPAFDYHGITMAGMNAVWALLLGLGVFVAYRRQNHA